MNWHLFIFIWAALAVLVSGFVGLILIGASFEGYRQQRQRWASLGGGVALLFITTLLLSAKVIWS